MKAWIDQLNPRQQWLVMALVIVAVLSGGYVGLWEPWAEARQSHRAQVVYHQATLDWLVSIEPTLEALRARQTNTQGSEGQSLLSLADQTARAAGLAGGLTRIEPINEREINVWLDGSAFEEIMAWLVSLSRERGVEVTSLSVTRSNDQSGVDARITLAIAR